MILRTLWQIVITRSRQRFYAWALREIDPLHPDVPYIVHKLHRLSDHQKSLAFRLKTRA